MAQSRNQGLFYFRHMLRETFLAAGWPDDLKSLTQQVVEQHEKLKLTQEEIVQCVAQVNKNHQAGIAAAIKQETVSKLTASERLALVRQKAKSNR